MKFLLKNKWLLLLLSGALLGIILGVIIYSQKDGLEKRGEDLVSSDLPREDMGGDDASLQNQMQQVGSDVNFKGEAQITYIASNYEQKLRIRFSEVWPADRNRYEVSSQDLSLGPDLKVKHIEWLDQHTVDVYLPIPLYPEKKIGLTLNRLPISEDFALVFPEDYQLQYTLPSFAITANVLHYDDKSMTLSMAANYPFEVGKDIRKVAVLSASEAQKITLKQVESFDNHALMNHSVILKGGGFVAGELGLSINSLFKVAEHTIQKEFTFVLQLQKNDEFTITSVMPRESSGTFAVEVNCRRKNVQKQRKKSEEDLLESYAHKCLVDAERAKDFIQIEPAVDFALIAREDAFKLLGKFNAATTYNIHFLPGMPGKFRSILLGKQSFSFTTPDFRRSFSFKGKARYLSTLSKGLLAYESRNLPKISVRVSQVLPQNIVFWASGQREQVDDRVALTAKDLDLPLSSRKNQMQVGELDLANLIAPGRGVYQIEVRDAEHDAELDRTTVVYTDLMLVAKKETGRMQVWARSMSDLKPVGKVKIKAFSRANQILASCETTDREGLCSLDIPKEKLNDVFLILAEKTDDLTYLRLSDVTIEDEKIQKGGRSIYAEQDPIALDIYAFASRGIYRPGESFEVTALVRDAALKAVGHTAFRVVLRGPRDQVLREYAVKTSSVGAFFLEVPTQKTFETGLYILEFYSGDKLLQTLHLNLEEFVPERIKIDLSTHGERFVNQPEVAVNVNAQYLFGSPVKQGDFSSSCVLERSSRHVPGQPHFLLGPEKLDQEKIILDIMNGQLNDGGVAQAFCQFHDFFHDFVTPMNLKIRVDVKEAGSGRSTVKSHKVQVSRSDLLLGVEKLTADGQKLRTRVQLFDLNGEKRKDHKDIRVTLLLEHYNWTYGYDPDYGYHRWHSEYYYMPEGDSQQFSLQEGMADIEMQASQSWGKYLLRVELPSEHLVSETSTYLGYYWYSDDGDGEEFATPKVRAPDQLVLATDKETVKPGEDVALSFEAPFSGQAMVCLESYQTYSCEWQNVKKGHHSFKIQAPQVKPNFYASVLFFKDTVTDGVFIPARAWGTKSIAIDSEAQKLDLKLRLPQKIRSQSMLDIEIETAQAAKDTEVFLAVVDEGILQITDFLSPDPMNHFHRPRMLGVNSYETLGWAIASKVTPGGDMAQGESASSVAPVRLVSIWRPGMKIDAQGKIKTSVEIPPYQGRLRVMAVAVDGQKYGADHGDVTVADPIVMLPTLPRFLSAGDRVIGRVALTNTTKENQVVHLSIESDPELKFEQNKFSVDIKGGASAVVDFPFVVSKFSGDVNFRFVATYGQDKTEDSLQLSIMPTTSYKKVDVLAEAGKSYNLQSLIPASLREDQLSYELIYSPAPVAQLIPNIGQLIAYPYGCLEQTTAQAFPLLVMREIIEKFQLKEFKDKSIDNMVLSGISRIASMQMYDGGFAYWPGGSEYRQQWASAFATHFLLAAKEQGYEVSKHLLDNALLYLRNVMSAERSYDREVRAEPYMAYVLGLAGYHQRAYLQQIAVVEPNRYNDVEQDFLVMGAIQLAQENRLLERFQKQKSFYDLTEEKPSNLRGSFYSARRSRALRLAISEELSPGDISANQLAIRVAEDMKNQTWTTQELAWALYGLVKRQAKIGWPSFKDTPSFTVDDKEVEGHRNGQFAMYWHQTQLSPTQKIRLDGIEEGVRQFSLSFNGYARTHDKPKPSLPLKIKREYFQVDGSKANLNSIKAGELIVVEIEVVNAGDAIENIAVVDRIPSGFDIENPRLSGETDLSWMGEVDYSDWYVDVRDHQIGFFGKFSGHGARKSFYYLARAVSPGEFVAPSAKVEDMYDPNSINVSLQHRVVVRP